jgi:tRNA (guanine37-N1)-methyltransferase
VTFYTISLFPELFQSWLSSGLIGQAFKQQLFKYENVNPRDFSTGVHHSVDDKVYGGGDGMAQSYLPWSKAIESVKHNDSRTKVIFLTPQGECWTQKKAQKFLEREVNLTFVCGRYAGFDERLIYKYADGEISIGDFVLNGGELPAQVVMETLVRGQPEVLGHKDSFSQDSFGVSGLLECPSFTRPQEIGGLKVPEFLLSGDHLKIETMRKAVSLVRTHLRRPDLIKEKGVHSSELKKAFDLIETLSEAEKILLGVKF